MLQVVRHSVAAAVSALAKAVELDLYLMVRNRGVLVATYYIPLLLDRVEQAEGVDRRLEVTGVGLVSDLASEVLVASPQDGGKNLT